MKTKSPLLIAVVLSLAFLLGVASPGHPFKTSSAQTLIDYGAGRVVEDPGIPPARGESASPPCCLCVFDAGGRTIGGPACFKGDDDDVPNVIFEAAGSRSVCLTVSNTGDCDVYVEMLKLLRAGGNARVFEQTELESKIVPGATKTLCAESIERIRVRSEGGGFCRYRWRLDDAERE